MVANLSESGLDTELDLGLTIEVASVLELSEASGQVAAGLFIKFTL